MCLQKMEFSYLKHSLAFNMASHFHGTLHSQVDKERHHTKNITSYCGIKFMRQPLGSFRNRKF